MDHRRIEDQNVAELYVTGRLNPEDEEGFETHLLECSDCRQRVGWADDLRTSIRAVAAEEAARASAQLGFLAWVARRTRTARTGMLMAALVAVAALPIWLQADRMRLERELDEARTADTAAARPAAPAPVAPLSTDNPTNDRDRDRLAQEKARLEEELRQSRTNETKLNQQLAQVTGPQINTPVVSLGVVRGGSDTNDLELGPSPEWMVLSLELPQAEFDTYRATLLDSRGKPVWEHKGLKPTASDTLTILLYSDRLQPGASYRIRLEGIGERGRAVPAGEIAFRAVKG